ncbi:hypothetical protein HUK82_16500, partial [Ameyamaea chiangmaiensis]|nr:hypothetical protein [Ameyamaea chiangmaiensis]
AGGTVAGAIGAAHAHVAARMPLACAGLALLIQAALVPDPLGGDRDLFVSAVGAARAGFVVATDLERAVWLTLGADLVWPEHVSVDGRILSGVEALAMWCGVMVAGAAVLGGVEALGDRLRRERLPAASLMLALLAVLMLFVERLQ